MAAPGFAQTTQSTGDTGNTVEQKAEEKPAELTQEQKDRALLESNLLGGWVRLGQNGNPISNENALAAANKCLTRSQGNTTSSGGDVFYINNGTTLQRLEPGAGSTEVVINARVVREQGTRKVWALRTGRTTGKVVQFRESNTRAGKITLMLEDNTIFMGCVSLIRLRQ